MPCYYDPFTGTIGCTGQPNPTLPGPPSGECFDVIFDSVAGKHCNVPCGTDLSTVAGYPNIQIIASNLTQAQILAAAQAGTIPPDSIQACQLNPPASGGGPSLTCYQLPSGVQIFIGPGEVPPLGAVPCTPAGGGGGECPPEPCPPPGTDCKHPLWIKTCPPDTVPGGQGGGVPPAGVPIVAGGGAGVPAGSIDVGCSVIDDWLTQFQGQGVNDVLMQFGITDSSGAPTAFSGISDMLHKFPFVGDAIGGTFDLFVRLPVFVLAGWISIQEDILKPTCKNVAAMTYLAIQRMIAVWVQRIFQVESGALKQRITNWQNYICPVLPPSIQEAHIARRTGDISQDDWKCWVRMNGIDDAYEERVYNSQRIQLTPFELMALWRRKQIADADIGGLLYQAGMISTDDQLRLEQITRFIPPVTDLLHFIVRGIGDPNIVQRFGLADEFDTLYTGQLVEWGEANGIDHDTMQAYHEAHWVGIAPGQLFTMLQRLRADNIPPGANQDDWIVTADDVNRALRENAIPPFWRGRLQAIAYNPIGIRQVQQAFIRGAAKRDEVVKSLQDVGYSLDNSNRLATWIEAQRIDHMRSHKVTTMYMGMGANRADATQRLTEEGYEDWEITQVLDWADQQADDKARETCLAGLKKRHECGEFTSTDLQEELSNLGLDENQVVRLTTQLDCQRKTCAKQVSAGTLCSWADSGLITPQEHMERLINVGYSNDDATRIVSECNIKLSDKQLAARQRALRQQVRDIASATNRQDTQQRRQLAAARRAANDLSRFQREQAIAMAKSDREKSRQATLAERATTRGKRLAASQGSKQKRIETQLAKAAQVWSEVSGATLEQAGAAIAAAVTAGTSAANGSEDQGVRAVLLAVLGAKKRGVLDIVQETQDVTRVMLSYAAIASVATCEEDSLSCPSHESNGNTSAQETTTETKPPGEQSSQSNTLGGISGR